MHVCGSPCEMHPYTSGGEHVHVQVSIWPSHIHDCMHSCSRLHLRSPLYACREEHMRETGSYVSTQSVHPSPGRDNLGRQCVLCAHPWVLGHPRRGVPRGISVWACMGDAYPYVNYAGDEQCMRALCWVNVGACGLSMSVNMHGCPPVHVHGKGRGACMQAVMHVQCAAQVTHVVWVSISWGC